ncbi:MAG TPA: YihY/virulence factor BrkB family protein [Planctomycetota bacterium]|nr:YihY/virulence factor BrkB family protein [Planctomycetota bacterium]
MNVVARCLRYLSVGLWEEELRKLEPGRRLRVGALRVVAHVVRSFSQNLASLQAAGLTLLTVLAMVPMLALVTSLAKALGYADKLDQQMLAWQDQFPKDAAALFEKLRELIATVNFGAMGLIGSVIVLWSALTLFTRIEQALNRVWRTRHSRRWYRRISDFIALMVMVPPLGILALVASSLLGGVDLIVNLRQYAWLDWTYRAGLGFVPHVLAWIAFTALYKIMPSARVQWRSAAVGGVLAGSTLVMLHGIYLRLNVGVANANAVYLTFAALPILLVYVQLLWTVVLAGAEVGYAVQNLPSLRGGEQLPAAPRAVQQRLAWHLVASACDNFRAGRRGVLTADVSTRLDVPMEWVDGVADQLVQGGVLVVLQGDDERLMPSCPPEQLDMARVTAVIDGDDDSNMPRVRLPQSPEQEVVAAREAANGKLAQLRF